MLAIKGKSSFESEKNLAFAKGLMFQAKAMHCRLMPERHEFSYNFYTYCFDLDNLADLDREIWGFGYNRFNLASVYDKDYLNSSTDNIKQKALTLLKARGFKLEIDKILLLTAPRYLGYVFNPASFYFCYDRAGQLLYFITEINNTYSEKHVYITDVSNQQPASNKPYKGKATKCFHVSPFFNMDYEYDFSFYDIREKLDIRINLVKDSKVAFVSRFWGDSQELNSRNHGSMIVRYPLRPALTMPRIMWQAIRLYLQRKLPVLQKPNPSSIDTIRAEPYSWVDQACISFLKKRAAGIKHGKLILVSPDGQEEYFGEINCHNPVRLKLNNFEIFRKIVFSGSIGLGESYVDGDWDSDDLAGLLKLFLNNSDVLDESDLNVWRPVRLWHWLKHKLQGNTLIGSRKNISAHYDLSNALFELFLDPSMMYSSALFNNASETLEQAQYNKIHRMLELSGIKEGEDLLEIGSGWGTLALTAAKERKARVTSLTLSKEQKQYAEQKARDLGLEDKVKFLLCDYRHAQDKFDAIVSVEMLEAVGHEHLDTFFASCERLLKPDGRVVIQFIGFPDSYYKAYKYRQDWIQKYIFPGSHLPALSAFLESASRSSHFMVEKVDNIADSYAKTLALWRETFNSKLGQVKQLGFDQKFIRMWNFYLASCEAEFSTRWLGLYQVVLTRPNNKKLMLNR